MDAQDINLAIQQFFKIYFQPRTPKKALLSKDTLYVCLSAAKLKRRFEFLVIDVALFIVSFSKSLPLVKGCYIYQRLLYRRDR